MVCTYLRIEDSQGNNYVIRFATRQVKGAVSNSTISSIYHAENITYEKLLKIIDDMYRINNNCLDNYKPKDYQQDFVAKGSRYYTDEEIRREKKNLENNRDSVDLYAIDIDVCANLIINHIK